MSQRNTHHIRSIYGIVPTVILNHLFHYDCLLAQLIWIDFQDNETSVLTHEVPNKLTSNNHQEVSSFNKMFVSSTNYGLFSMNTVQIVQKTRNRSQIITTGCPTPFAAMAHAHTKRERMFWNLYNLINH